MTLVNIGKYKEGW